MLPAAYQLPAAAVLLVGGFVSCFLGYRLFKFVLGVFGFIIGALAASSIFGASDTTPPRTSAMAAGCSNDSGSIRPVRPRGVLPWPCAW